MRAATSRASSWLKYRQNRRGVSFAKLFLAGRRYSFRFAFGLGLAEMNLPIGSPKAGVRTLTFDSDVLSRQVSLKNRVWQRRLLVPVGPYTRKTLAIGG